LTKVRESASGRDVAFVASVLRSVTDGRLTIDEAARRLTDAGSVDSNVFEMPAADPPTSATAPTAEAQVDLDRERRCGFPEVIYSEGKSTAAVVEIMETLVRHGERGLATRVSPEQADALMERFPAAVHSPIGRTVRVAPSKPAAPAGRVVVVTAGTSDRPVAEEAIETLKWMECGVELLVDIGVAGPKRLLEQKHRFEKADAVIVIAGMEGALPSVVGGWVACPVIAVPTSVGYGASFGGIAALLGMLNSCASNVCVVNIDSGFKGAYIAGLIARRAQRSDAGT
jgi:pyridinium-3,5-biscarboxylic acid mononucleotide synthase